MAVDVAAVPFSLSNPIEIGNSIRDGYGLDSGPLCEDLCPLDVISLRRESTVSTASDKLYIYIVRPYYYRKNLYQ